MQGCTLMRGSSDSFVTSAGHPVYYLGEDRYVLARQWSIPRENISVFLTEGVATIEFIDGQEVITPASVESAQPVELPAGWSPEAIVSVLAWLPAWLRNVCLWAGPPFPDDSADGDNL